jgi:hypothetical protein
MAALPELEHWDGYGWFKDSGVQSESEAWSKLKRADWMLRLAKLKGVKLDEAKLRLFACDCAERVLPAFERLYPDDPRPSQAIVTARRFVKGEVAQDALENASVAAGAATGAVILADAADGRFGRKSAQAAAGDAAMAAAMAAAGAADITDWAALDAAIAAVNAAAEGIASDWDSAIGDWNTTSAAKTAAWIYQADKLRTYFPDPFKP